jgi:hypothetical protein
MNEPYNTNQSISNKQEPLPYSSSPMVDNGKSLLNKQSIEAPRVPFDERENQRLKPNRFSTFPPDVRNSDINIQ